MRAMRFDDAHSLLMRRRAIKSSRSMNLIVYILLWQAFLVAWARADVNHSKSKFVLFTSVKYSRYLSGLQRAELVNHSVNAHVDAENATVARWPTVAGVSTPLSFRLLCSAVTSLGCFLLVWLTVVKCREWLYRTLQHCSCRSQHLLNCAICLQLLVSTMAATTSSNVEMYVSELVMTTGHELGQEDVEWDWNITASGGGSNTTCFEYQDYGAFTTMSFYHALLYTSVVVPLPLPSQVSFDVMLRVWEDDSLSCIYESNDDLFAVRQWSSAFLLDGQWRSHRLVTNGSVFEAVVQYRASLPPTPQPTASPSMEPTTAPTQTPTSHPTAMPTNVPSSAPTLSPTMRPSEEPTRSPSDQPSLAPTSVPTMPPSRAPTSPPSPPPSMSPTLQPSVLPTPVPSAQPSTMPTHAPTHPPSPIPTVPPGAPSQAPSRHPTLVPTAPPTSMPTSTPTRSPTLPPTHVPTTTPPSEWPSMATTHVSSTSIAPTAVSTVSAVSSTLPSTTGMQESTVNSFVSSSTVLHTVVASEHTLTSTYGATSQSSSADSFPLGVVLVCVVAAIACLIIVLALALLWRRRVSRRPLHISSPRTIERARGGATQMQPQSEALRSRRQSKAYATSPPTSAARRSRKQTPSSKSAMSSPKGSYIETSNRAEVIASMSQHGALAIKPSDGGDGGLTLPPAAIYAGLPKLHESFAPVSMPTVAQPMQLTGNGGVVDNVMYTRDALPPSSRAAPLAANDENTTYLHRQQRRRSAHVDDAQSRRHSRSAKRHSRSARIGVSMTSTLQQVDTDLLAYVQQYGAPSSTHSVEEAARHVYSAMPNFGHSAMFLPEGSDVVPDGAGSPALQPQFHAALERVRTQQWLRLDLDRAAAEQVLNHAPVYTYLVRFYTGVSCALALSYVAADGRVRHVPIFCRTPTRGTAASSAVVGMGMAQLQWLVPIAENEYLSSHSLSGILEQSFGAGFRAYAYGAVPPPKPKRHAFTTTAGWQPPHLGHCAALLRAPGWMVIDAERRALAIRGGEFPTNVRVLNVLNGAENSMKSRALQWLLSVLREMSAKTRPIEEETELRTHVLGAFAIHNPQLLAEFEESRTRLQGTQECGEHFNEWLQSREGVQADHYLGEDGANHYREKLHDESERVGGAPLPASQCRASFLLHGTSARAILPIIVQGFRIDSGHYLAQRRDYFGIGTYFTDTLSYSLKYSPLNSTVADRASSARSESSFATRTSSARTRTTETVTGGGVEWIPENSHALLLSDVQWSNAFPCIENPVTDKQAPFREQTLKHGFDAHVALVVRPRQVSALKRRLLPGVGKAQNTWQPVDLRKHRPFGSEWAHEFVVPSGRRHALPLFLVFVDHEFWQQMTSAQ